MNYQKIHNNLIERARTRVKPDGYCERHHIQPKSMGGTNQNENLVWLLGREHYLVHWLLFKIYRNQSMAFAWYRMTCNRDAVQRYTSYTYLYAKLARSEYVSKLFTGRKHSVEHRAKLSAAKFGKTYAELGRHGSSPLKGRAASDSHRKNISLAGKGLKRSDETKRKISAAKMGAGNHRYGVSPTADVRQKQSASLMASASLRSSAVLLSIHGKTRTVADWARHDLCLVKEATVRARVKKGWDAEDAVFSPVGTTRKPNEDELRAIRDEYRRKVKELKE